MEQQEKHGASRQPGDDRIERLLQRRRVLILYIDECRKKEDWHGVRDAATDIEVCQAELGACMDWRARWGNVTPETSETLRSVP